MRDTLDRIVSAIAEGMQAEVCSLYLFDPQRERLVLRSTFGLDRDSVGKVSMRPNEGLVGMVIESGQPVTCPTRSAIRATNIFPRPAKSAITASSACRCRRAGSKPIGVLVAQTLLAPQIHPQRERLLRTAATQVAQILSHFRLRETLATKEKERDEYRRRMIEANRQLKDYEKVGGKARLKPPIKVRRPRLVGLPRGARLRAGRRARGRHIPEHYRPQSARPRHQGRAQTPGRGARALAQPSSKR